MVRCMFLSHVAHVHVCVCLKVEPGITPRDFHKLVGVIMGDEDIALYPGQRTADEKQQRILVGLHTCGELASTMLHVFASCHWLVGLVSVGCCYMKPPLPPNCDPKTSSQHERDVTTRGTEIGVPPLPTAGSHCLTKTELERGSDMTMVTTPGGVCPKEVPSSLQKHASYPLSRFVQSLLGHELSYTAKELACHAVEVYLQKLTGTEHVCMTGERDSSVNVFHMGEVLFYY